MNRIATLSIALCLAAVFAVPAQARSHFTIVNNLENGVMIRIYDGSDAVCGVEREQTRVNAKNTGEFHCKGQGQDRCKVEIFNAKNTDRICKGLYDTCDGAAKRTADGAVITVDGTGKDDCYIIKK